MGTLANKDKMLVPKKDRLTVYRYLFKEGVMVAKKDVNKKKHDDPELPVRNLYVMKLMNSLKSRGYVTEKFSWQWYYWYLPTRASSTSVSTFTFPLRLSHRHSRRPPAPLRAASSARRAVATVRTDTAATSVARARVARASAAVAAVAASN